MGEKQETFAFTDELVTAVLSRDGEAPDQRDVQKLTFGLVGAFLTTDDYVRRRWGAVQVPAGVEVRELIVGRDGWKDRELPESIVAIDVNLAEEDLLDPTNRALGPMRWLGIFHLAHGFVKALHGDIDGQSFAQGCETVGDLLGLLKPALKMLTPVQIAVMAVAHDLGVQAEPWEVWLDQVNEYLTHWRQAQVPMVTLRKEIEDLRKRGFTVHDSGQDLRIPTTMVVVSVKRIREAAQRLRRR
ncbi:TPA: hypothetical protein QDC44_001975 [Burkholderia cepacia ATCC 25416]|nr:hypothetical protein [Burkholderia cepacia ATCC 25416]